jgi:hypothetical protein
MKGIMIFIIIRGRKKEMKLNKTIGICICFFLLNLSAFSSVGSKNEEIGNISTNIDENIINYDSSPDEEHYRGDYPIVIEENHDGGFIHVPIYGKWVEGDITVIVRNNKVDWIDISIYNNKIVYGDIKIILYGNYINPDGSIIISVYDNGGNSADPSLNEVVGGSIIIDCYDNFGYDFFINVWENWVHNDIVVDFHDQNLMSNVYIDVIKNHIGNELYVSVQSNAVDVKLSVTLNENIVAELLDVLILNNKIGWWDIPTFADFDLWMYDNHVAKGNMVVNVNGNENHGSHFQGTIYENGAYGDIYISVQSNFDHSISVFQFMIYDNLCGHDMTININANSGFISIIIHVYDNSAGNSTPNISCQDMSNVHDNKKYHAQSNSVHSDNDGLTDEYEEMIGTNPGDPDTDKDGFYDGWTEHAILGEKGKWEKGERLGEIGDPLNSCKGSISRLFNAPIHDPNPVMKDIYVEIDMLPNAKYDSTVISDVVDIFAKHCIRLHIDTGWPLGPDSKPNSGGGQQVEAWQYKILRPNDLFHWTFFYTTEHPRIKKIPGRYNDFYDYKVCCFDIRTWFRQPHWSPYFDGGLEGMREDIFHYCLAAEYILIVNKTNKILKFDFEYSKGINGMADICGDDIILATLRIHDNVRSLEKVFMHELGHNLGLTHTKPEQLTGDETIKETVMNPPASDAEKLDYLRKEWASIDLTCVEDGRAQRFPPKWTS